MLTLFGALACAELASAFPRTGGVYVFLKETYSPVAGFLWGWAMFWVMHSGIIAAMATVFGRYAGVLRPARRPRDPRRRGVARSSASRRSTTSASSAAARCRRRSRSPRSSAVALIVVVGFVVGSRLPEHFQQGAATAGRRGRPHSFLLALIAGLFAFGGWHVVTYTAEETVQPERTIPRALALGIVDRDGLLRRAQRGVFLRAAARSGARSRRASPPTSRRRCSARRAARRSRALVMFSVFGAMTGSMLAAPRVYFAMARDGLIFRWMGDVHPRFRTPHRAIVLQAIWASALVWSGTYRQLFTRVIFTEWIFFALMAGGIFLLRRRPGYAPAYRVWGYPWVPARVRRRVGDDRRQPARLRAARQRGRPRAGRPRRAGVLLVGPPFGTRRLTCAAPASIETSAARLSRFEFTALFRVHRLHDEFLHARIDVEALAILGRPVVLVRPHLVQPFLNLRVSAGEALDQRPPARGQRLRVGSRRILAERGRHVCDERGPLFGHLRLQLRVPERLALLDLRLRVLAVVLLRPVCAVLHFDLPHDGLEQIPVGIAAGLDGPFRSSDRVNGQVELPPFPGQHDLLAPQGVRERRLALQQPADLLQRQAEKLQHDDLFEAHEVAVAVEPVAAAGPAARFQQPEPVVVMQRAHGDARERREFPDAVDVDGLVNAGLEWRIQRTALQMMIRPDVA